MNLVLNDYVLTLGWVFALAISVAVAFAIFLWILDRLTGDIDLIKELKRNNLAVGIMLAAAVLGLALAIAGIL